MTLLNEIIDFSKFESNEMKITYRNFKLNEFQEMLDELGSIYYSACLKKGLEFFVEYDPVQYNDLEVKTDTTRIRQILTVIFFFLFFFFLFFFILFYLFLFFKFFFFIF